MNPLDDPDGTFEVLRNEEGQHSLWIAGIEVPAGWERVYGPAHRDDCSRFVEAAWLDQRPASFVRAMDGDRRPEDLDDSGDRR